MGHKRMGNVGSPTYCKMIRTCEPFKATFPSSLFTPTQNLSYLTHFLTMVFPCLLELAYMHEQGRGMWT